MQEIVKAFDEQARSHLRDASRGGYRSFLRALDAELIAAQLRAVGFEEVSVHVNDGPNSPVTEIRASVEIRHLSRDKLRSVCPGIHSWDIQEMQANCVGGERLTIVGSDSDNMGRYEAEGFVEARAHPESPTHRALSQHADKFASELIPAICEASYSFCLAVAKGAVTDPEVTNLFEGKRNMPLKM